ncbi:M20/M25/M40 family metallo-hydrolase [Panacibacter ginsenosidivorans]|uniref:M20/M25/M40 family metallo-hydrolase n=1 Tax=Panacibacter ginsenosidivorans TaxID=1813871 RepID=A0A5B8V6W6_9BACT|nr:M28 family peptidase [Panacibacter ginsenosidivorans]QEC67227.1 M20/M25/M40 family metallo-hydrolase [Panacibacter ginsenosidivorans]
MKKTIFITLLFISPFTFSQKINKIINAKEVERIEKVLSADDMKGRAIFTPGIDKAADFISSEFKNAGLKTFNNADVFRQSFIMLKPKRQSVSATADGQVIDEKNIIIVTTKKDLSINDASGFEKASIKSGDNFFNMVFGFISAGKNYVVTVDTAFAKSFPRLQYFTKQVNPSETSVIFILAATAPTTFKIEAGHSFDTLKLANVVGMLPGKSKKDEFVIFSGHYDHLGVGKVVNGDSIYNGANDDAAGTTAVIMLAKYFAKLHNNERTIIFAAFTGEESGGYGSKYFSEQLAPSQVMAMFNIEMIGTDSKWGNNSAYITGYEKTDMGKILQQNLTGSAFTFYPDPYTEQNLFYRSDNATLARLGVPAHTISTSKMDSEPNYHKVSDEMGTLDMNNMAEIIKAIAISSASIVAGKDTPSRVDTSELK